MSFFNRFVFNTFLFLAFFCFGVSAFAVGNGGSPTTYEYYKNRGDTVCRTGLDDMCQAAYGGASTSQSGCTTSNVSCPHIDTGMLELTNSCVEKDQWGNLTGGNTTSRELWYNVTYYSKATLTCQADEEFKLTGCVAECVPKEEDPCEQYKDQEFNGVGQCGSFSCPNGGKLVGGGGLVHCDKGDPTILYQPPNKGVNVTNSCNGNLKSYSRNASVNESLTGSSSGSFYCSAVYTYDGTSGTPATTPNNLAALTSIGAVPQDGNGDCPADKPLKGDYQGTPACFPNELPDSTCPIANEKPNANGLCVPPTDPSYPKDNDPNTDPNEGTPNTCPKGQIKNLSGTCVPYGDATECPTGQTRNNMGLCSATPDANSCPQGQTKNAQGICANDPRGTGCNDGSLPNSNGVCANGTASCGIGQTRNAQGVCVSASSGSGCKDGSTANSSGMCADGSASCGAGKVRNAQGTCIADTTDPSQKTSASLPTNCTTAPACDGDPILCAMYNQQWKNNCEAIRAPNENEKAQVMGAISDTNSQIEANENEYKAAIESIIGGSGLLNNPVPTTAQCIPDKQVVIMNGLSVTVPFMLLCPYFTLLRSMLIMVAYMFAARIVYAELTGGGIRV